MAINIGGQQRRVGLALSGGGFRAALFHLGVMRRLNELRLLDKLDVISSVSGGSITAGVFAAMPAHPAADFVSFQRRVLRGVWLGPRTVWSLFLLALAAAPPVIALKPPRVLECALAGAAALGGLAPGAAANRALRWGAVVFAWAVLAALPWGRLGLMGQLFKLAFWLGNLKLGEIRRTPQFFINATCLNTASGWVFTREWISDDRATVFNFAPNPQSCADPSRVALASAIGASACVPGLFTPYTLKLARPLERRGLKLRKLRLVDGGAYDNQGIWVFLPTTYEFPRWMPIDYLIASDAAYPMDVERRPLYPIWPLNALGSLLRTASIWEQRTRDEAYEILERASGKGAGELQQYALFYIGGRPAQSEANRDAPYAVPPGFADALAQMRTDLDHFSSLEIRTLMYHGYTLVNHRIVNYCYEILEPQFPGVTKLIEPLVKASPQPLDWQQLPARDGLPHAGLPTLDSWSEFNAKLTREHPWLLRTPARWRGVLALESFDEEAGKAELAQATQYLRRSRSHFALWRLVMRLADRLRQSP